MKREQEKKFEQLKKRWQDFYQKVFGIESDFSSVEIPKMQEGFERLIIVEKGMTIQLLFEKCAELFPSEIQGIDLDKVESVRIPLEKAYAVWIRDSIEADENLKNLSVEDIEKMGIAGQTLEERLILELKYYTETIDQHLDPYPRGITVCTGSRFGANTPFAYWNHGVFSIKYTDSVRKNERLRARQTIF